MVNCFDQLDVGKFFFRLFVNNFTSARADRPGSGGRVRGLRLRRVQMTTLSEYRAVLGAEVLTKVYDPNMEIVAACGADLMSDVLSFAHFDGTMLLSGLTNPQVVRTAEMAGIVAIVFVRGKIPPPETVALAEQRGITLLTTPCSMFEACGRLYRVGVESVDVRGAERQRVEEELSKLSRATS